MAKIYTIKIADAHLSVVIAALSERPFKVAQPIIASIGAQIAAQQEAVLDPDPAAKRAAEPESANGQAKDFVIGREAFAKIAAVEEVQK